METLKNPPKLKGLDFSIEEILEARDDNRLLMITPFVSSLCDLACGYCYAGAGKKSKNELTTKEFKDVILQGKDLGARTVWIPGAGEPLLQEDFKEIVEFIDRQGMTLVMFTNSTHMTKDYARFLYEHNVSVITKLNSFSRDIQDELTRRKRSFEKIQRGLDNLLKNGFNKESPTRLGIESVICSLNYEEIPSIFVWAREHNIYPYLELIIHSGRAKSSNLDIPRKREKDLFYKLLKIDQERFGYSWTPVPPYVATECNKLFYNLVVDNQGNIQPCCALDIHIGNIREVRLRDVYLNSNILKKTRRAEEYAEGCKECKNPNCYYGCRSETFCEGDLFGIYKRCWHLT